MSRRKSRAGRAAVVVGGAGLLLWLLLRGAGWRLGRAGAGTKRPPGRPCRVHIDEAGLLLDGARADLPAAIRRCRTAGGVEVTATGAALVGTVAEILRTLEASGVTVRADPDLFDIAHRAQPTEDVT